MTVGTILWFAGAGTFTAALSNRLRGHHMFRKPHINLGLTLFGTYVGYRVHLLENDYDKNLLKAKTLNPLGGSLIPRQHLLTYQEMMRKKQGGQMIADVLEDEDFEDEDEDEEDEDDE